MPMVMIFYMAVFLMLTQLWLFWREISFHKKQDDTLSGDYRIARLKTGAVLIFVDAALLLIWIFSGAINVIQEFWTGIGLTGTFVDMALLVTVIVFQAGARRILAAYQHLVVEKKFGFGKMTAQMFLRDTAVQALLLLAISSVLAWVSVSLFTLPFLYIWIGVWLLWLVFNFARSWAHPLLVAPLFNAFTRLDNQDLINRIDTMMGQVKCDLATIQVMDGSRRSSHGNAHVSGFGAAKKVVLLDTLLTLLNKDEIVAVLAHELGHVKHGHIIKFEIVKALTSFIWIAVAGWYLSSQIVFEINGAGAILATLWLATPVFHIIARPVLSWLVRGFEFQADAFVIAFDNPKALVQALKKLHKKNAASDQSDPIFSFVYSSHPSMSDRLARLTSPASAPLQSEEVKI